MTNSTDYANFVGWVENALSNTAMVDYPCAWHARRQ